MSATITFNEAKRDFPNARAAWKHIAATRGIDRNDVNIKPDHTDIHWRFVIKPKTSKKSSTRPKARKKGKALTPISHDAALARFLDADRGGRGGRKRNPVMDLNVSAGLVAPADPKDEAGIRLQHRWFRHPNELDFEGVDTDKAPKPKKRKTKKKASEPKASRKTAARETPSDLDDNERKVLAHVRTQPTHIDEITRAAGIGAANTSAALTTLELSGKVRQVAGMNFVATSPESPQPGPKTSRKTVPQETVSAGSRPQGIATGYVDDATGMPHIRIAFTGTTPEWVSDKLTAAGFKWRPRLGYWDVETSADRRKLMAEIAGEFPAAKIDGVNANLPEPVPVREQKPKPPTVKVLREDSDGENPGRFRLIKRGRDWIVQRDYGKGDGWIDFDNMSSIREQKAINKYKETLVITGFGNPDKPKPQRSESVQTVGTAGVQLDQIRKGLGDIDDSADSLLQTAAKTGAIKISPERFVAYVNAIKHLTDPGQATVRVAHVAEALQYANREPDQVFADFERALDEPDMQDTPGDRELTRHNSVRSAIQRFAEVLAVAEKELGGEPVALVGTRDTSSPAAPERVRTSSSSVLTEAPSITNPQEKYTFRWRVLDLDDLVTSHDDAFNPNPDFPEELQPRIRDRTAPRLQIEKIARTLAPDALLDDTHQIDRGPMIVGVDRVVESGNGRTMALRRARDDYPDRWQNYQDQLRKNLEDYGFTEKDLEGIEDPVLVRERVSSVDRTAFTREANQSAVIQMSPIEQALQDAKVLSDGAIANMTVSENQSLDQALTSAANRDLVRHYLDQLPANERAGLIDAKGNLNIQGLQRMKAALFAKVYGGEAGQRLTQAFFETLDPMVKNIENGLFASLPATARSEGLIRTGQRDADLSIAEDISKAVDMMVRLKQENLSVEMFLQQSSFIDKELTANQETLLAYLSEIGRSPKRVRELFNDYAETVQAAPPPNQGAFFDNSVPTKEETLANIIQRHRQRANEGRRNRRQRSLFAEASAAFGANGPKLGGPDSGGRPITQRDLDRAAGAAVRAGG